jgi:hypothetical protein
MLEISEQSLRSIHENLFQVIDLLDPIMKQVMADPVKCHDGFTYDRKSIEHYFRFVKRNRQIK